MKYDLLIKNGRIVFEEEIVKGDIGVRNGVIATIGEITDCKADTVIDADGKYIYQGLIDCHVHGSEPGFEDYEDYKHVSSALAVGGVTTFVDMPCANKPTLSNADLFKRKQDILAGKSKIDYAFYGGCFDDNTDDLKGMWESGVVGFKNFMCPGEECATLGTIRRELRIVHDLHALAAFHCEDESIVDYELKKALREGRDTRNDWIKCRPLSSELIATKNVIELAKEMDASIYICHVTHPEVAELIKKAKQENVKIKAETCGNYLIFDETDFMKKGTLLKCTPPLREAKAKNRLWEYLLDGTLDCIGSDHSPTTFDNKDESKKGFFACWSGVMSAQTTFQVLFHEAVHNRNISPCLFAKIMGSSPAEIFGLKHKGKIACGYDADFTIVDPEKEWTITKEELKYVNKMSAYVGLSGKGKAVCTISRGMIVVKNGEFMDDTYNGKLLIRK